jgi:hypothetical protein
MTNKVAQKFPPCAFCTNENERSKIVYARAVSLLLVEFSQGTGEIAYLQGANKPIKESKVSDC